VSLAHDDEAARVRTHVISTLTTTLTGTSRTRKAAADMQRHDATAAEMTIPAAEEAR
jgi:hypothetical protein